MRRSCRPTVALRRRASSIAAASPLGARGLGEQQQVERLALPLDVAAGQGQRPGRRLLDEQGEHRLLAPVQRLRLGPLVGLGDAGLHLGRVFGRARCALPGGRRSPGAGGRCRCAARARASPALRPAGLRRSGSRRRRSPRRCRGRGPAPGATRRRRRRCGGRAVPARRARSGASPASAQAVRAGRARPRGCRGPRRPRRAAPRSPRRQAAECRSAPAAARPRQASSDSA